MGEIYLEAEKGVSWDRRAIFTRMDIPRRYCRLFLSMDYLPLLMYLDIGTGILDMGAWR
jgi:hypothetical protein